MRGSPLLAAWVVAVISLDACSLGSSSPAAKFSPRPTSHAESAGDAGYWPPMSQPDSAAAYISTVRGRPLRIPTLDPGGGCPVTPETTVNLGYGVKLPARGIGPFKFGPYGAPIIAIDFNKTPWYVPSEYDGPLILRGGQIDGGAVLAFGFWPDAAQPGLPILFARKDVEDRTVVFQGELDIGPRARSSAEMWSFPHPGCYAVQADGESFSDVTVVSVSSQGHLSF